MAEGSNVLDDPAGWPSTTTTMGMCACGHVANWHDRGEPGATWNYGGPCRVGLCACKGYTYSKRPLGGVLTRSGRVVEPGFYAQVLDRIVRWRMEAQGIEHEADWLDEYDCLDFDKIPDHLIGSIEQMRENALRLADTIVGLARGRL